MYSYIYIYIYIYSYVTKSKFVVFEYCWGRHSDCMQNTLMYSMLTLGGLGACPQSLLKKFAFSETESENTYSGYFTFQAEYTME